jgi:chloramphenicol O-acetyltransferase type A
MEECETTRAHHHQIDLSVWPRRDHFKFFSSYEEPFFSITAEVDCTGLLARCERLGVSKTLSFWHGVLRATNAIEEFRYRILDGRPVLYDTIHLSPTILRPDGTFTIAFVPFKEDFQEFCDTASEVIARAKETTGFDLDNSTRRIDLIHFSTVPWFRFTGLTHARSTKAPGSEPKITLGKFGPRLGGGKSIPVSITGHHGLMDGYQIGQYLEHLEEQWS